MIPTSGFPLPVQRVLAYSPGSLLVTSIRHVLFDEAKLVDLWAPLCGLAPWGVLTAVAARRLFTWERL